MRYTDPAGARRQAAQTFATKTDAERWLVRTQAHIIDGHWKDPREGAQLLDAYATAWISERPGLRPRTVDLYRWLHLRYIKPALGDTALARITPARVRAWRTELLESGVSTSMSAKAYRLLRAVLNTAVDDAILDRNPCRIRGAGDERPAERPVLNLG